MNLEKDRENIPVGGLADAYHRVAHEKKKVPEEGDTSEGGTEIFTLRHSREEEAEKQ